MPDRGLFLLIFTTVIFLGFGYAYLKLLLSPKFKNEIYAQLEEEYQQRTADFEADATAKLSLKATQIQEDLDATRETLDARRLRLEINEASLQQRCQELDEKTSLLRNEVTRIARVYEGWMLEATDYQQRLLNHGERLRTLLNKKSHKILNKHERSSAPKAASFLQMQIDVMKKMKKMTAELREDAPPSVKT